MPQGANPFGNIIRQGGGNDDTRQQLPPPANPAGQQYDQLMAGQPPEQATVDPSQAGRPDSQNATP